MIIKGFIQFEKKKKKKKEEEEEEQRAHYAYRNFFIHLSLLWMRT